MKDMSKVYLNLNGVSLKNITEISWNKPTPKWTQDDEDIYGEHENVYAGSRKLVITVTVRNNTDDSRNLKLFEIGNVEGVGTLNDSRGKTKENIAFDKAVVMNNDKTYNRTDNTTQYIINASIITETAI